MTDRASFTLRQGDRPFVFHASNVVGEGGERCSISGKMLQFGPGQFSVLLSPIIDTCG